MREHNIAYSYKGVPTLARFSDSPAFIRGAMGPFGSGKSSACVMQIYQEAEAQAPGPDGVRRVRWGVIRNTYKQLTDTTEKTFFDWFDPGLFGTYYKAEHRYMMRIGTDLELEILFRALDRPEHVSNLLSAEYTSAWVNEAREVPRQIISALIGRIGRYPSVRDGGPTRAGLIMDTNPPDTDSWWYKMFEEERPKDCELFKQPSGRGPLAENLKNLPPDYYSRMASIMSEEEQKVYIDGEYGYLRTGKPVFPEYVDTVHCQDVDPTPGVRLIRGWDFGLTPACEIAQLTPNGQIRFVDELVAERAGIEQFGEVVMRHCAEYYREFEIEDVADPSGGYAGQTDEQSCFDILNKMGVHPENGIQDVTIRIESVKHALRTMIDGEPGLVVSPKCRQLRKGFQGGYKYRKMLMASERYMDRPDKNEYSHPHDCAQYICAELIGDIVSGAARQFHPQATPRVISEYDPFH